MKFNSQIVSSASGSIGGCTYSRNRSGQYIRRRAMPVNSGSFFAQVMTAFFGELVNRWTSILTPEQRASWDLWATNTPQTDPLGNSINWTGQNAFISMNAFRLQGGETYVDQAPAIFAGTALSSLISIGADESTQLISVGFSVLDEWANTAGGILSLFASRPQNPSINYFKGPYRLGVTVLGDPTPPTSPVAFTAPFPVVEGQRVFIQARAAAADGRISPAVRSSTLVVA